MVKILREADEAPVAEIARKYGISDATIYGWRKRYGQLECELLNRRRFKTQVEARVAIFEFIEGWYNPHRRHSALGQLSPVNYERRMLTQAA